MGSFDSYLSCLPGPMTFRQNYLSCCSHVALHWLAVMLNDANNGHEAAGDDVRTPSCTLYGVCLFHAGTANVLFMPGQQTPGQWHWH